MEASVTWNNGPVKKDKLSITRVAGANNWYEWDVTDYLDSALKTGTSLASVTFWLEGNTWTGSNVGLEFDSRSKTNRPQLRITASTVATHAAIQCLWVSNNAFVAATTTPPPDTTTTTPRPGLPSVGCTFSPGWVAIIALTAALLV